MASICHLLQLLSLPHPTPAHRTDALLEAAYIQGWSNLQASALGTSVLTPQLQGWLMVYGMGFILPLSNLASFSFLSQVLTP